MWSCHKREGSPISFAAHQLLSWSDEAKMYTSANTWTQIHQASISCWILIQNNKFMQRTKNVKPVSSKLQHGQTDRQCHYNPLEQSGPSCSSSEEKRQVSLWLRGNTACLPVTPWKKGSFPSTSVETSGLPVAPWKRSRSPSIFVETAGPASWKKSRSPSSSLETEGIPVGLRNSFLMPLNARLYSDAFIHRQVLVSDKK